MLREGRRRYRLAVPFTTVGRDHLCNVIFDDDTLSRRHAVLCCAANETWLVDSGSANGSFVNDERVTCRRLREGDRVRMGAHAFVFEVEADGGRSRPAGGDGEAQVDPAAFRDEMYAALGHILLGVHEASTEEALAQRLLAATMASIRCDRGFVAFVDGERLVVRASRGVVVDEEGWPSGKIFDADLLRRHVIRHVMANPVPYFSLNPHGDFHLARVFMANVASVFCVPMVREGETLGLLHGDTSIQQGHRDREDLPLVEALARHGALALWRLRARPGGGRDG